MNETINSCHKYSSREWTSLKRSQGQRSKVKVVIWPINP